MPHRVEIEMRSRFLRYYEINSPYDFQKLLHILPGKHILFVKINARKLLKRLHTMGLSNREIAEVRDRIAAMHGDIALILDYLRKEVHVRNTRQLVDLLDTNELALKALKKWAAKWPKPPVTLRPK